MFCVPLEKCWSSTTQLIFYVRWQRLMFNSIEKPIIMKYILIFFKYSEMFKVFDNLWLKLQLYKYCLQDFVHTEENSLYYILLSHNLRSRSAGNRINALVQYRFLFPRFSLITLQTGHISDDICSDITINNVIFSRKYIGRRQR